MLYTFRLEDKPEADDGHKRLCAQQAERDTVEWALKEGFQLAAQKYIAALGSQGKTNRLQELLVTLRRHYKALKLAPMVRPVISCPDKAPYMAHLDAKGILLFAE